MSVLIKEMDMPRGCAVIELSAYRGGRGDEMNCEKCRWYRTDYMSVENGKWLVHGTCLVGHCNGSQYEPKEMDEVTE